MQPLHGMRSCVSYNAVTFKLSFISLPNSAYPSRALDFTLTPILSRSSVTTFGLQQAKQISQPATPGHEKLDKIVHSKINPTLCPLPGVTSL